MKYKVDWHRTSRNNGYTLVYCPDHPRAWSTGYVYEHIVVAEMKIGRELCPDESVHHCDGDRRNNSPHNLKVLHKSALAKLHAAKPRYLEITCDECGKVFKRRANQRSSVKNYKHSFCSRRCSGRYIRRQQLAPVAQSDKAAPS